MLVHDRGTAQHTLLAVRELVALGNHQLGELIADLERDRTGERGRRDAGKRARAIDEIAIERVRLNGRVPHERRVGGHHEEMIGPKPGIQNHGLAEAIE